MWGSVSWDRSMNGLRWLSLLLMQRVLSMCAFPKHSVFSLTIMQGGFLFYMLGAGQYIRVKDANTSLNQNHSNKSDWPSLAKGP